MYISCSKYKSIKYMTVEGEVYYMYTCILKRDQVFYRFNVVLYLKINIDYRRVRRILNIFKLIYPVQYKYKYSDCVINMKYWFVSKYVYQLRCRSLRIHFTFVPIMEIHINYGFMEILYVSIYVNIGLYLKSIYPLIFCFEEFIYY